MSINLVCIFYIIMLATSQFTWHWDGDLLTERRRKKYKKWSTCHLLKGHEHTQTYCTWLVAMPWARKSWYICTLVALSKTICAWVQIVGSVWIIRLFVVTTRNLENISTLIFWNWFPATKYCEGDLLAQK